KGLVKRDDSGGIQGLEGRETRVFFNVSSRPDASADEAAVPTGQYVLAADEATRCGGSWLLLRDLRWETVPENVVGAATRAEMEFENHVITTGTLPLGTPAP